MNLITEKKNQTLLIMINRPKALNALSTAVIEELEAAIDQVYQDDEIRGVIIIGAGDKAFVAGADISEFIGQNAKMADGYSKRGHTLFDRIEKSPKPILAAVNGFALGGGCELAMACHIRVASENAKFGQPEIKLGIIAGYGGTQRLVQHIGRAKATELLLTGDMIGADEALDLGLANYVVKPGELADKCMEILRKIYAFSPLAVAKTLDAIDAGLNNAKDGYATEAANFAFCIASEDGQEGAKAFLEKRKPVFKGK